MTQITQGVLNLPYSYQDPLLNIKTYHTWPGNIITTTNQHILMRKTHKPHASQNHHMHTDQHQIKEKCGKSTYLI